jgi:hypothetical protein
MCSIVNKVLLSPRPPLPWKPMPRIVVLTASDVGSPRGGTSAMGRCRSNLCYVYPWILRTLGLLNSIVVIAALQAPQMLFLPAGPRLLVSVPACPGKLVAPILVLCVVSWSVPLWKREKQSHVLLCIPEEKIPWDDPLDAIVSSPGAY